METIAQFLRRAGLRLAGAAGWIYLLALAWVAVYICREAFFTESTGHFNSMRGEWLGLARIQGLDWFRPRWWPYWGGGAPLEFTYAPLVPFSIAALARFFHCSPALALNIVTGFVYCLGPLALYFAMWRFTKAAGASFVAALIYLAGAPPGNVDPRAGFGLAWFATARQTYRLLEWDDLPHVLSLALLPLAVWLLARALRGRRRLDHVLAGAALAAMMLASMFGFVLGALAVITVPLAMERRFAPALLGRAALTGAAAYLAISPWAPPSLLRTVRDNAAFDGEMIWSWRAYAGMAITALAVWVIWRVAARRTREWPLRWIALFACPVILIPTLDHYLDLHFLPQSYRYQIEMTMALALVAAFAVRAWARPLPPWLRVLGALALVLLAERQVVTQRRFVKLMLRPVDVSASVEKRAAQWIEANLPGQRVVMPGSIGFWLNAFSNTQQLTAQPYTTAVNRSQQIATYALQTGQNLGPRDAEYSVIWMKAFGVQAIGVPGRHSPEYWKPYWNPLKFEGVLPVLWRENDTTIYRVPQASASLAHVMRADQLVKAPPHDGSRVGELRTYVAALDEPAAPASFEWRGANRAIIRAHLKPGQVISAQITYDRGWRAAAKGAGRPIRRDGLGLMEIEPGCAGDCEISLEYAGSLEARLCRVASLATVSAALILLWTGRRRSAQKMKPTSSAPRG